MAPTLNIIGAGKVGRVLGRLFAGSGTLAVQDVLTRSPASAVDAVRFMGAGLAVSALAHMRPAQCWMLAVADDQIAPVCDRLAALPHIAGSVVFHCSGAKASAELAAAAGAGALTASVHPVRSFADPAHVAAHFAPTFCGIEGDAAALALLAGPLAAIGARTVQIDAAAKTVYHAASVFASNYLVTVLDAALRAWQAAGVPPDVARALAAPLAAETLDNVLRLGPEQALTGPIARGDMATVARQQQALDAWDGASGDLYRALAGATVALAARR
ncbi:DUF2520 domain-containing protein [Massilia sp. PAMC28688]|uniref:Rossmann-like and DUF2520 domain-containing protein n=1 Tax=Massilia sp. PAMC28688 TaxID=2861283 RepID=UPI001C62A41D|nr:Rossmann-like and DUF2520 domain-containing protein [Massilia sp. PAMC28688]QYF95127.1 DUF2520 domain-containing protein [Massilia sp. PAMC28688]